MKKSFLSLFVAVLALAACGKKTQEDDRGKRGAEIVAADIQSFDSIPTVSESWPGAEYFEKVFGGRSGSDVREFVQARAKYFTDARDKSLTIYPTEIRHNGWNKAPLALLGAEALTGDTKEATMAAFNLGTSLWFQSVIDERTFSVVIDNRVIPVESTRTGILFLGDIYTDVIVKNGKRYHVPEGLRQTILVHESRHSDCTNGIKKENLKIARNAKNHKEFRRDFPHLECGHLHAPCPESHPLKGLAACDEEPWGAYGVEWLFEKSRIATAGSTKEWEFYSTLAIDSKSRLIGDTRELKPGSLPDPDMSSEGLID